MVAGPTAAATLVVRRGGLGDTLLMLPVLHALRARAPERDLHFAGVLEFAEVLQQYGVVDRACSSEDLRLWALGREDPGAASARFAGYGRVVGDDPVLAALPTAALQVDLFDPRPQRSDLPLGEQLLAQLGLPGPARHGLLRVREHETDGAIVLAPGSGSPSKCWPRARWLEMAAALAGSGSRITVVVGPTERERDDPQRWPWPEGTAWLADLSAAALARRLSGVRAFVGNDSGPTHLAAALLVPTIAIFGPGEPRVWAPVGAHVRVVGASTEAPPDVAVAVVNAALRSSGV